ncbi:glycosyltransferase [Alphaproteobacteria bacterium LSUCC0744]
MQQLTEKKSFNGKVNIILSSYNHGDSLLETIKSVAEQSFTDFECVVIDDCSTDNSIDVLDAFNDSRFFFKSTGRNPRWCETWNDTISLFPADSYYAMAHSDDLWQPHKLQKQVDFLNKNTEFVASFSDVNAINQKGEIFANGQHSLTAIFRQPNRTRYEWLRHFFLHGNCLCHPSAVVRTELMQRLGGYRYNFTQLTDFDMWVRVVKHGHIHVDSEKLISFRVRDNDGNSSTPTPDSSARHRYEFMEILRNFIEGLSKDDLIRIFPDCLDLINTKDYIPEFALSMIALKLKPTKPHQFYALATIHQLFKQPGLADLIWDNYNFSKHTLSRLTAKISPI